jgi:thiamine-monophosphate kinase
VPFDDREPAVMTRDGARLGDSTGDGKGETLADRGEQSLVDAIVRRLPQARNVSVPPGDDAAVVLVDSTPVVVTTDVLVENVHFRLDWCSAEDVGHRAAAASLADVVAMGATPVALVVAVTAPASSESAWLLRLADGLRDECAAMKASVVGGDVSSGPVVTVTTTAIGRMGADSAVLRSGAEPGDVVGLAGRIGWAEAGLAVLIRGFRSPRALVDAYRRPEVPYAAAAKAVRGGAHAMCDVSDGLIADLGHIARMSKVGIDIDPQSLSVPDPIAAVAAAYGVDPFVWMLTGGHDHALVATFAAGKKLPRAFQTIGAVREAGDQNAVTVGGKDWSAGPGGHEHFTAQ